jgi:hypothetical protein
MSWNLSLQATLFVDAVPSAFTIRLGLSALVLTLGLSSASNLANKVVFPSVAALGVLAEPAGHDLRPL